MVSTFVKSSAVGLLIALAPTFAHAQSAPAQGAPAQGAPSPFSMFGQNQTLQSAHVWVTDRSGKRELAPSSVQIAKTNTGDMGSGASGGSVLKDLGASALSVVAGPVGAIAGGLFGMFGHHAAPKPNFHMVLALAGQHAESHVASGTPSFELNYADTPGLDPDAYTPAILKLTTTSDNWRLVAASDSEDASQLASFMMPAGMSMPGQPGSAPPKLTEDRVAGASIQIVGRGKARIIFAQALDPGEYGIVLRPIDANGQPTPPILRTVWDFSV